MPGGLLNLTAVGNQNVFLTGNPKKTFFKTTYSHYTNFGMQKFRIDLYATEEKWTFWDYAGAVLIGVGVAALVVVTAGAGCCR